VQDDLAMQKHHAGRRGERLYAGAGSRACPNIKPGDPPGRPYKRNVIPVQKHHAGRRGERM